MNIQQICETYVANTYKRYPVTFVRGAGAHLWDEAGREYIDLGSGIAVNIFGVSDPIWAEAVTRQLAALPHTCNLYYAEPCARLAEMLCERTGMRKVFFSNSGAEANECMIKAARKYGEATGRSTIVTLKDSFHGRTIATLAATGQDVFHQHFGPFPAGFAYATPNDLNSVRALCEEQNACAVMLEVVQGEGGVRALDGDFLRGVEALCREKDMLFCIDEVQTGNGRSGELYAYMVHGLKPDIVSTAKGLGGGLPIGATLLGRKGQKHPHLRRPRLHLRRQPRGLRRGGEHTLPSGRGIFAGRARARRLHPRRTGGREGRPGRGRPRPHARHRDGKTRRGDRLRLSQARRAGLDGEEQGAAFAAAQHRLGRPQNRRRRPERGDRGVKRRYLVLSSGAVFEGYALGAEGEGLGELVFTTNMCGYPETLTDPSYAGQIILQTFPLIGNYGIIPEDFEGECRARGYVVREACEAPSNFRCQMTLDAFLKERGVPAIMGVDTREITRILREEGVMNALICDSVPSDLSDLRAYAIHGAVAAASVRERQEAPCENARFRVALLDYGAKHNIVRELNRRGCHVSILPHDTAAEDVLSGGYDGVMLSNGPGDPAENAFEIKQIQKLMGKLPVFGICLGHQLMALAQGGETVKLKYGHRGANQPVRDLMSERTLITSQNHGYAVKTDGAPGMLRYINANDGTCEGLDYPEMNAFSVQFHPEACAGPQDAETLFDRFVAMMGGNAHADA